MTKWVVRMWLADHSENIGNHEEEMKEAIIFASRNLWFKHSISIDGMYTYNDEDSMILAIADYNDKLTEKKCWPSS